MNDQSPALSASLSRSLPLSKRRPLGLQNQQGLSPPQPPPAPQRSPAPASHPPRRRGPGLSAFPANRGFHTCSKDKALLFAQSSKTNRSAGPMRPPTASGQGAAVLFWPGLAGSSSRLYISEANVSPGATGSSSIQRDSQSPPGDFSTQSLPSGCPQHVPSPGGGRA